MPDETLLTIQDAAKYLGIGETAIRNAIYRERIPFRMLYGRKLITLSDLEHYRATARPGRPRRTSDATV